MGGEEIRSRRRNISGPFSTVLLLILIHADGVLNQGETFSETDPQIRHFIIRVMADRPELRSLSHRPSYSMFDNVLAVLSVLDSILGIFFLLIISLI